MLAKKYLKMDCILSSSTSSLADINHVLPAEILILILKSLPSSAIYSSRMVCKDWNDLIVQNILKNQKTLILTGGDINIKIVSHQYDSVKLESFISLRKIYSEAEHLYLKNFYRPTSCIKVFSDSSKLRKLTLEKCFHFNTRSLSKINKPLAYITHLSLNVEPKITDGNVHSIASSFKHLEFFTIKNCSVVGFTLQFLEPKIKSIALINDDKKLEKSFVNSMLKLHEKGMRLQELNLESTLLNIDLRITSVLSGLKFLRFSDFNFLEAALESDIAQSLVTIEYVEEYSLCQYTTLPIMTLLSEFFDAKFPNLKNLRIELRTTQGITNNVVQKIARNCQNLVKLILNNIEVLRDSTFFMISEMKNLKNLSLCYINMGKDRSWGLFNIIKNCSNLGFLQIRSKSYRPCLKEKFIYDCFEYFDKNPQRKMEMKLISTFLPSHKNFTIIPKNLNLQIFDFLC
ncbi:hypothetical protein SSS_01818 [Sarcoptes scabiei]|uniref:F-box domain-containing protein n=1 Tax=Sarcoptes scabiei TaxID=52283 RepID=A0A834RHB6_SARSC|nr:hypothetical protein SSS_01818 [Sarcoptes scabiei]